MTKEEISKYRDALDVQLKEKTGEFEKYLLIGTTAMLGFFLTINEKFIGLFEADQKLLMFVSIGLLATSITLLLIGNQITAGYDKKIINLLDSFPKKETTEKNDIALLELWQKGSKKISRIKFWMIFTFIFGILFEIGFFLYNTNQKKAEKDIPSKVYQVDIFVRDSTNKVLFKTTTRDTIH